MADPGPHLATPTNARGKAIPIPKRAAEREKVRLLERRVKRLESTIRLFLGAEKLTPAQREELVGVLAGVEEPHGKGTIDLKYAGVVVSEQRLLERFRALDVTQRRLVSLLVHELAKKGAWFFPHAR